VPVVDGCTLSAAVFVFDLSEMDAAGIVRGKLVVAGSIWEVSTAVGVMLV
jgi:hypothetical protein